MSLENNACDSHEQTFQRCGHGGSALPQLFFELLDLVLVLPEQRVLRIFVDLWLVLDLFGAVGVAQRAERLVIVVVGGGETGHHHRLGVTTQRVLPERRLVKVLEMLASKE